LDLSSSSAVDNFTERIDEEDEKELNEDESTMAVNFDSTNNVGPTVKDATIA
jgi:hypothetical protein